MTPILLSATILLGVATVIPQVWAGQITTIDPQTGAKTWKIHTNGVSISLTQLLPDQLRAFYLNRGFTLNQIEGYATACVYTLILRNDNAPGTVHFVQSEWSLVSSGGSRSPMDTEGWLQRLQQAGATKPALIAFRWAQFPSEHEYAPNGDWNQGMLATDLPAGSRFDFIARWNIDGKPHQGVLTDVRCIR
ncbi:MAG: hypothetical protein GY753_02550 [Gammaproteobacteria bacterium]|nr:hypothetical protein [Gammaproteobacteria bacterium]